MTILRHEMQANPAGGDDGGYLKTPYCRSAVHPCAQRRCIHLGQFATQMCLLSVHINIYFGMTVHANCTFHVCSFGYAAISRSFNHTREDREAFRALKASQAGCILLPMQMSDVC